MRIRCSHSVSGRLLCLYSSGLESGISGVERKFSTTYPEFTHSNLTESVVSEGRERVTPTLSEKGQGNQNPNQYTVENRSPCKSLTWTRFLKTREGVKWSRGQVDPTIFLS